MAKNIIRENDYEKDTYRSYSYNYLLYGSCLYMKAGKTEKIHRALRNLGILRVIWNGVNENKRHKNLKLQRVINGCVAYCVFSIIALVSFYYGNVVSYSYIYSVGIAIFIAFLINAACIVMYEQVQENANVEIYARMAYMDTMTGLGNRAEIEFADEQSNIPISVAMGYVWTDAKEKNLQELIHCADEKMYQDKKQIKENTPSV